jgi:hypothetical protein
MLCASGARMLLLLDLRVLSRPGPFPSTEYVGAPTLYVRALCANIHLRAKTRRRMSICYTPSVPNKI